LEEDALKTILGVAYTNGEKSRPYVDEASHEETAERYAVNQQELLKLTKEERFQVKHAWVMGWMGVTE